MRRFINMSLMTACVVLCASGCTTVDVISDKEYADEHVITLRQSKGAEYLSAMYPLNPQYIGFPFLFDGEYLFENEFDAARFSKKHFHSHNLQSYRQVERLLVDMQSGFVESIDGISVFKDLNRRLLTELSAFSGADSVPPFMVVTVYESVADSHAILIIEDPNTAVIHGFVETVSRVPLNY